MFAFLLQIHKAAHALHGRGANFALGHSCELEGPKLKAGCWRLDLRRLGRRAAEGAGARGLGFKLDPLWLSAPYGFEPTVSGLLLEPCGTCLKRSLDIRVI